MITNHGDTETAAREAYRAEVQRVNRSRDHEINEALRPASHGVVTVTEAMVEAACMAAFSELPPRGGLIWNRMRAALTAALAVGV